MKAETLKYIVGNRDKLEKLVNGGAEPIETFARKTLDFLEKWQQVIKKLPEDKKTGPIAAFAFWCRKASLIQQKESVDIEKEQRMGLGLSLQFVPSNIPALFAYSLAAGLLAGNSVIIRMPSKISAESQILVETLKEVLAKETMEMYSGEGFADRIVLIQYDHEKEITDWLSRSADIRVIWGGDESIRQIQESPLKTGSKDITFPDRHSMAIIDVEEIPEGVKLENLVRNFYNDTYANDQNACSAPAVIIWNGEGLNLEDIEGKTGKFWGVLLKYIHERYEMAPLLAIKKVENALYLAACGVAENIKMEKELTRVRLAAPDKEIWKNLVPGGFFAEYYLKETDDLIQSLITEKCQTIACFGEKSRALAEKLVQNGPAWLRAVPIGQAMDFSLIWDGHDLIREQST